jgi:hypothetical protein
VHLDNVDNLLQELWRHADLHCMDEVGLSKETHDTGNIMKHGESSVNMV